MSETVLDASGTQSGREDLMSVCVGGVPNLVTSEARPRGRRVKQAKEKKGKRKKVINRGTSM